MYTSILLTFFTAAACWTESARAGSVTYTQGFFLSHVSYFITNSSLFSFSASLC